MKNMKKILALALVVMSVLAISIPALAYTETPVSGTRYITASNGLPVNVRKGPGTNYALANVGSFPVGTQVTLQSKATGTDGATWYKVVNSSNAGGWVKGTYLTTDHPSEADWVARYKAFEIDKGRLSFRVTVPYSEERRHHASCRAKLQGNKPHNFE